MEEKDIIQDAPATELDTKEIWDAFRKQGIHTSYAETYQNPIEGITKEETLRLARFELSELQLDLGDMVIGLEHDWMSTCGKNGNKRYLIIPDHGMCNKGAIEKMWDHKKDKMILLADRFRSIVDMFRQCKGSITQADKMAINSLEISLQMFRSLLLGIKTGNVVYFERPREMIWGGKGLSRLDLSAGDEGDAEWNDVFYEMNLHDYREDEIFFSKDIRYKVNEEKTKKIFNDSAHKYKIDGEPVSKTEWQVYNAAISKKAGGIVDFNVEEIKMERFKSMSELIYSTEYFDPLFSRNHALRYDMEHYLNELAENEHGFNSWWWSLEMEETRYDTRKSSRLSQSIDAISRMTVGARQSGKSANIDKALMDSLNSTDYSRAIYKGDKADNIMNAVQRVNLPEPLEHYSKSITGMNLSEMAVNDPRLVAVRRFKNKEEEEEGGQDA